MSKKILVLPGDGIGPEIIAEAKAEAEKEKSEAEEIEEIRNEMEAIGAAYDRRWKLPKLRDALIAAKKEGKKEE